jgi:hypothetical protein
VSVLNPDWVGSGDSDVVRTPEIEFYAKASCRQLCERMVEVLPRELRDIVYSYLQEGQAIQVIIPITSRLGDKKRDRKTPLFRAIRVGPNFDRDAHYFMSEYVGHQFQYEILEEWYRGSVFFLNNAKVVKRFCSQDEWGAGVIPAQYIHNIVLRVGHNTSFPGCAENAVIHVKDSVRALRPLFKCRSGLLITIEVSDPYGHRRQGCKKWQGEPEGFKAIPWRIALVRKIFPTIRRLAEQGQVVHLVFAKRTYLCTAFEDFSEKAWIKVVENTA